MPIHTQYGFVWNHVEVTRACSHRGSLWLDVKTPRETLEIRVTPSGLVRTRVVKRQRGKAGE